MKYAKQLQQAVMELPKSLQEKCISYKTWKKDCKKTTLNINEALLVLIKQCCKVDKAYLHAYTHLTNKHKQAICWKACLQPSDVLRFANVNAQTVYKVAKRLSKVYQSPEPLRWLVTVRTQHTYAFMGGNTTTHLQLSITKRLECPICMEDFEPNKNHKVIVFHCGHYACLDCVLQYAGVTQLNGTWFNLLAYAKKRDCPICRDHLAFDDSICVKD